MKSDSKIIDIKKNYFLSFWLLILCLSCSFWCQAQVESTVSPSSTSTISSEADAEGILNLQGIPGLPALSSTPRADGGQDYTITIQLLAIMTALTLLPSFLLMMTAFTRIIIVFAILRQALGLQQTPSNQILLGLSLFLTLFIMQPVFETIYEDGFVPYSKEELTSTEALKKASVPVKEFMLSNTRESDLALFVRLSRSEEVASAQELSLFVLAPAFLTSELKTAFQIGFLLFVPFLVIDLVVASVLMAMGMVMLSPIIISLPFKIMLFVLVDGWAMVIGSLASSYGY